MKQIKIKTEFIKLDQFLKFCGEAESGAMAKYMILEESVSVNGNICKERGKKIRKTDVVSVNKTEYKVISDED